MTGQSSHLPNKASMWLNILAKYPRQLMPVYPNEFATLSSLAPITPEKVIRDEGGEPRIFMVHRDKTIDILKNLYRFHSKDDVTQELNDADI